MILSLIVIAIIILILVIVFEKIVESPYDALCGIGIIILGAVWGVIALTYLIETLVNWLTN